MNGSVSGNGSFAEKTTNFNEFSGKRSTTVICLEAIIMSVIIVMALTGNSLILAAIYRFRTLQTITNVFVANLAVADICLAVLGMPFTLASSITYDWIFGETMCKIQAICNSVFCEASILTLTFVSLERYIAIIHPLKYQRYITPFTVKIMVAYIWIQALICATSTFLFSRFKFLEFEHICTVDWAYNMPYTLFFSIFFFFVPFIAMAICYAIILRTALRQRKRIEAIKLGEICNGNQEKETKEVHRQTKKEHKATIMIAIVVGSFSACWFPHAVGIYCLVVPSCHWSEGFYIATTWLAMLNSALNSGIYGLMNTSFKRAFKSILLCDRYVSDSDIITMVGQRSRIDSKTYGECGRNYVK